MAIARRMLNTAPPQFALVGISMGGYVALEIVRQAPERVLRLALLDTSARSDRPEQTEDRREQVAMAKSGRFSEVISFAYPLLVHPDHREDEDLKRTLRCMAKDVGIDAFERQQTAIMSRIDSRPTLGSIRCPTLVGVGDCDAVTPVEIAREIMSGIPNAKIVVIPDA